MFARVRAVGTIYPKISTCISTLGKPLLKKETPPSLLPACPAQSAVLLQNSKFHIFSSLALKLHEVKCIQSPVHAKSTTQYSAEERLKIFAQRSLRKAGVETSVMDTTVLWPPARVRGMKELDVEAFQKTIEVPIAKVSLTHIGPALKVLKKYYLKLRNFNAIAEGPADEDYKITYLNPLSFTGNETKVLQEIEQACKKCGKDWNESDKCPVQFGMSPVTIQYKNWTASETLAAVLPLEQNGVSGYSAIGHIIHLNLKEYLDPYKKIIGQILLDKSPSEVTMVVNKADTIDNSDDTFRSFSMEILAGEGDTVATVKENMCRFTFDFAKVYWNPRLSTEHEAIVSKLQNGDVLYDVMAGVGPFSVPAAAQKKCEVLCNDLNPESFRWLTHNISLNKVSGRVAPHNLDGGEFIRTVLKNDLLKRWRDPKFTSQIHVTMNLPSIAVEFLTNFVGLMSDVEDDNDCVNYHEPCVHVYMFSKDQKASSCATKVAFYLGLVDHLPDYDQEFSEKMEAIVTAMNENPNESKSPENQKYLKPKFVSDDFHIPGLIVREIKFVRKVAPHKAMIRVSVVVTKDILLRNKCDLGAGNQTDNSEESNTGSRKKIKLDVEGTGA
ncbi:tRNA (guanine(37)-N(1))-methyltransferase eukaryotic [Trinorchestia longiramus]|nr:tRNA (guanine(37)-N(1))-methyltransferase eukaryotic [Trinorchestia longiramus]